MAETHPELKTPRLLLRAWRPDDEEAYAELNADPQVTEYLLGPFTRAQSDAQIQGFRKQFVEQGFGRWAVEAPGLARLIGMVGLSPVSYAAPFAPSVEIAWRLARPHWGQGFATEAAAAALRFGFESLELEEIVALTVPANQRSQAVMRRLGMQRKSDDDFDHPLVPVGHPLRRHVLYRLTRAAWRESMSSGALGPAA